MLPKIYRRVTTRGLVAGPEAQAQPPAIRFYWRCHVQSCLRRDISSELTITQFAEVVQRSCFYCGAPPGDRAVPSGTPPLAAHGVDRLDNARPYSLENSVAACKRCNAMKSDLDAEEFLRHVITIARHLGE